jgi:hypothetical protein
MIFNYPQLYHLVKRSNHQIKGGFIQKITSSPLYFSFKIRKEGKNFHFNIGRGNRYEALWVSEASLEAKYRVYDQLVGLLRKYFTNAFVINIDLDLSDRIVKITLRKKDSEFDLYLFYKARESYLQILEKKEDGYKICVSFLAKNIIENENIDVERVINGYELFDYIGRSKIDTSVKANFGDLPNVQFDEKYTKELNEYVIGSRRSKKKTDRIYSFMQKDLKKAKSHEFLFELAQKPDDDLILLPKKYKINDLKINFSDNNPHHRRNEIYNKCKRLKQVLIIVETRIKEFEQKYLLENKSIPKDQVVFKASVFPKWSKGTIKKLDDANLSVDISKNADDYYLVKTDDYHFYIGKNAKGNDFKA